MSKYSGSNERDFYRRYAREESAKRQLEHAQKTGNYKVTFEQIYKETDKRATIADKKTDDK